MYKYNIIATNIKQGINDWYILSNGIYAEFSLGNICVKPYLSKIAYEETIIPDQTKYLIGLKYPIINNNKLLFIIFGFNTVSENMIVKNNIIIIYSKFTDLFFDNDVKKNDKTVRKKMVNNIVIIYKIQTPKFKLDKIFTCITKYPVLQRIK
ncbi:hypothetical protein [Spiroplasma litorale]|uniref:hypothetical protein n=1 Tax=Spiroplasma litorale TaxID=216942 RepID=UPI001187357E|nr:hypothetical protein [Spiroplasma litorale]